MRRGDAFEYRYGTQTKIFMAIKHGEMDVDDLANVLCSQTAGASRLACEPLARSVIGFVANQGAPNEFSFDTVLYLLKMAKEKEDLESALDAMFRQVSKGEMYDLEKHAWVDDPAREAKPNEPYVLDYAAFKAGSVADRRAAVAALTATVVRLGYYPGYECLSAAVLARYGTAGVCGGRE